MLQGLSIIGSAPQPGSGETFSAVNPATGERLTPLFHSAALDDVRQAANLAAEAFVTYGKLPGAQKGHFLRTIASSLEGVS